jgi:hypothetical protein
MRSVMAAVARVDDAAKVLAVSDDDDAQWAKRQRR